MRTCSKCEKAITENNQSGLCTKHCIAMTSLRWYYENREKRVKQDAAYQKTESGRAKREVRRLARLPETNARAREARKQRPEGVRELERRYRKSVRGRAVRSADAARRNAIKAAGLVTLKEQERLDLMAKFELAQRLTEETGIPHVVDHYFPLRGKCCKGKHHPDNLRVITAEANSKKSNKCPLHNQGQ